MARRKGNRKSLARAAASVGGVTQYTYDSQHRMTAITDAMGRGR